MPAHSWSPRARAAPAALAGPGVALQLGRSSDVASLAVTGASWLHRRGFFQVTVKDAGGQDACFLALPCTHFHPWLSRAHYGGSDGLMVCGEHVGKRASEDSGPRAELPSPSTCGDGWGNGGKEKRNNQQERPPAPVLHASCSVRVAARPLRVTAAPSCRPPISRCAQKPASPHTAWGAVWGRQRTRKQVCPGPLGFTGGPCCRTRCFLHGRVRDSLRRKCSSWKSGWVRVPWPLAPWGLPRTPAAQTPPLGRHSARR